MKKHLGYWFTGAAVLILTLVGLPLLVNTDDGGEKMQTNGNIPPIDTNLPEVTETATFALG